MKNSKSESVTSKRIKSFGQEIANNPIIAIAFAIIVGVIIILVIASINFAPHKNPYGDEIQMDDLSLAGNVPQDDQDKMKAELYKVVQQNVPEGTDLSKIKAKVREKSVEYLPGTSVTKHNEQFIVDLDDIEQSYVVSVEWDTDDNSNDIESGYPVSITCLTDPDDLIYQSFECRDFVTESWGTTSVLARYLPRYTEDYSLVMTDMEAEKPKLSAIILVHSFETPFSEKEQKADEVKNEILDYIKSLNENPDDYDIEYSIEYGD